mgnify:CR=1 FL=1
MSEPSTSIPTERDWLEVLRGAVQRSSQRTVAARLGVSTTMVSQALSGRYPSSLTTLERRVRGTLLAATVNCPVLGQISERRCEDEQRRPFSISNPTRVRLYVTCRKCPNCHTTPTNPPQSKGGR